MSLSRTNLQSSTLAPSKSYNLEQFENVAGNLNDVLLPQLLQRDFKNAVSLSLTCSLFNNSFKEAIEGELAVKLTNAITLKNFDLIAEITKANPNILFRGVMQVSKNGDRKLSIPLVTAINCHQIGYKPSFFMRGYRNTLETIEYSFQSHHPDLYDSFRHYLTLFSEKDNNFWNEELGTFHRQPNTPRKSGA